MKTETQKLFFLFERGLFRNKIYLLLTLISYISDDVFGDGQRNYSSNANKLTTNAACYRNICFKVGSIVFQKRFLLVRQGRRAFTCKIDRLSS